MWRSCHNTCNLINDRPPHWCHRPMVSGREQGVNAVVFSGFGCAHRVLCDLGSKPVIPGLDQAYNWALGAVRDSA